MASLSRSVCSTTNSSDDLGLNLLVIPVRMLIADSSGSKNPCGTVGGPDHRDAFRRRFFVQNVAELAINDFNSSWLNGVRHNTPQGVQSCHSTKLLVFLKTLV